MEKMTKREIKIQSHLGKKFGRLTVLEIYKPVRKGIRECKCICECGNETITNLHNVTKGQTSSCGCLQREKSKKSNSTHGCYEEKLYYVFRGMNDRCYNKKNKFYSYYGGKGVIICDEWKEDFSKFREWAFKNGYKENEGLSIERLDVNGNYEPNNCKWANRKEQSRNKTNTWFEEYNGEVLPVIEICDIYGFNYRTIYKRKKAGKKGKELFERKKTDWYEMYNGKRMRVVDICKQYGFKYQTIMNRKHRGKKGDDLFKGLN